MIWDVAHHRGVGFPLHILRPVGVYPVLSSLCAEPRLRPADLIERLEAATAADVPLVGLRDLPDGISSTLGYLRRAGLIVRCFGNGRGAHTRYEATALGAGLIGSLSPVTAWAMNNFDFVVDATRVRLDLPPLDAPVPEPLRAERSAAGMAISLLGGAWSDTVMVYVDSAGPDGIGPSRLEATVNTAIDASTGESKVERHLHRDTLYRTLQRLVAKGLLERREDPPQVRYLLSPHGRGLMDALWQVSDGWAVAHDTELFEIMAQFSGWFPHAVRE